MIRTLNADLQKKVTTELNEDPNRIDEDIRNIRDWLKKQLYLNARTDDQSILTFLRGCKFSLQKTKQKLDCFYTLRTLVPEFFADRDPLMPKIQEILKAGIVLVLPKTVGAFGPRVLIARYSRINTDTMLLNDIVKVFYMIFDILLKDDDNTAISGIYVVVDQKDFPLSYLTQYTPSFIKKAHACGHTAYPMRVKGVYVINTLPAFETVYNMVKVVMSPKMQARMKLFSKKNFHKIYADIPKEIFPTGYENGEENCADLIDKWKAKVENNRSWFLEDEQYRSNEALRPGTPKTCGEIFGVEGSFRKLNID